MKINRIKVNALWENGKGSIEISKKLKCSNETIKNILKDNSSYSSKENYSRNTGTKVYQYSQEGILIKGFSSIASAAKEIGIDPSGISKCCNNVKKSAGGYFWSYNPDTIFTPSKLKRNKIKKVAQLDKNNNIIKIFNSMSEAGKYMNKKQTKYIKQCCQGEREEMYGFKWCYVDKLVQYAAQEIKEVL